MIRAWDSPTPIRAGSCVHLSPRTPSRGGGTDLLLEYAEIWPSTLAHRVFLDPEEPVLDGDTPTIAHSVVAIFDQLAPTLPPNPEINPTIANIIAQAQELNLLPGNFDIYTDGSWRDKTNWLNKILHGPDPTLSQSSGAVCLVPCEEPGQPNQARQLPMLLIHIADDPSAPLNGSFSTELISLLLATHIAVTLQPRRIVTDCESLVKRIHANKLPKTDYKRHHSVLLRSLLSQSRRIRNVPIVHIHSHADKDRNINDCTRDQQGNVTADRVAALDLPWITQHCPQATVHSLPMASALRTLQASLGLHISRDGLIQPLSLANTFQQNLFQQYIKTRLQKTSRGAFWREASYHLAATAWNMATESLPQRASSTRILFDKLWEPWNTHHYADLPGNPTCLNCEGIDSLSHLLSECPHTAQAREELLSNFNKLIQDTTSDLGCTATRIIRAMALSPEGAHMMIGLWQPHHTAEFLQLLATHQPDPLTQQQAKEVGDAILHTTRLLVTTAQTIVRHRITQSRDRKRPAGPRRHPEQHVPIWTQFLLNKKKAACKRKKKSPKPKPVSPALAAARARTDKEAEIRACVQAYTYDNPPPAPRPTPVPPQWALDIPFLPTGNTWGAHFANQHDRHIAFLRSLEIAAPAPRPPTDEELRPAAEALARLRTRASARFRNNMISRYPDIPRVSNGTLSVDPDEIAPPPQYRTNLPSTHSPPPRAPAPSPT